MTITIDEAVKIKERYQYILQDASFPELIEADNLSIEALKRERTHREGLRLTKPELLPGETPFL